MIRKDLNSPSMYETGIAMSDLSCFINSDLARDLTNAIMTLFGVLTPLELRLGKKLIELLTDLIHILVPISSDLPNHNASIQLCVQKLQILIEDSDQNLKYIGLLAKSTILHTHPKSIQSHSDLIMRCLDLLSRMSLKNQNILKIIIYLIQSSNNDKTLIQQLLSLTIDKMSLFLSSGDVEAQERTETTSDTINGNDCIELTLSQGTNATSLQLTLSDQLYRQAKIDEENRLIHDNDDDIYPTVKVTRDGELPENTTESENKDNDNDVRVEKNKKYDLYRALNIDLNEKSIQSISMPSPWTSQLKESVPKQKKKIIEKQEQLSTSKSKHKREHSDDKELLLPTDEEENRPTSSTPSPPPPDTAEKTKVKKSSSEITTIVYTNTSVPLLLDIMTDDIHPTNQSE
ncbi:unnamed protein product [Rotaria sordida]|uniref:Clathrin/coatomer adaptor adaptin-like N-terminal domain-containing protein n=1 Tax=Rotaria sordida TaxID=392033 RepID=A0A815WPP3_9BILA|nr:unnamed protein product [Rotaria sordida]CAF1547350.1 unnamed protein product [Rotaria sordida]